MTVSKRNKNVDDAVLVFEARSRGRQHAAFNAGLVAALLACLSEWRVLLAADPGHLGEVRGLVEDYALPGRERMEYLEFAVPGSLKRQKRAVHVLSEYRVHRRLSELIRRLAPSAVLLCSTSRASLAVGRISGWQATRSIPTLVVLHDLSVIRRRCDKSGLGPRPSWLFRGSLPRHVTFVVLAPVLRERLVELYPCLEEAVAGCHIPSLLALPVEDNEGGRVSALGRSLTIGWIGGDWRRSMEDYVGLARRMSRKTDRLTFAVVGYPRTANREALSEGGPNLQIPSGYLSNREYTRGIRSLDLALWLGSRDQYDWSASASFIDAIVMGCPVAALETVFSRGYFSKLGSIGWLCKNLGEVERNLVEIAQGARPLPTIPPVTAERIESTFAPSAVGTTIAELLGELPRARRRVSSTPDPSRK